MNEETKTQIVRNALADDIPFENIKFLYNLTENEVVHLMKKLLPIKQFIKWRTRARGAVLKNLNKTKINKQINKQNE